MHLVFYIIVHFFCTCQSQTATVLTSNTYWVYVQFDAPTTWSTAQQWCFDTYESTLATIRNSFYESNLENLLEDYWDIQGVRWKGGIIGAVRNTNDDWEWSDGVTSWSYTNFFSTPNDLTEKCMFLGYNTCPVCWYWDSYDCSTSRTYICNKYKSPTSPPTTTINPTVSPTTHNPTTDPSHDPTTDPTIDPSNDPTSVPTMQPTDRNCSTSTTCEWYLDCLESRYKCKVEGYPVSYGYYYCNRYVEYISDFSEKGQKWVYQVMSCLQKVLVPVAISTTGWLCDDITSFAFDSHGGCYTDGIVSICDLSVTDWITILKVVNVGLFSMQSAQEIGKVIRKCTIAIGESIIYEMKLVLDGIFDEVIEILYDVGEDLVEWAHDLLIDLIFDKGEELLQEIISDIYILNVASGSVEISFLIMSYDIGIIGKIYNEFVKVQGQMINVANYTNKLQVRDLEWITNLTYNSTTITTETEDDIDSVGILCTIENYYVSMLILLKMFLF